MSDTAFGWLFGGWSFGMRKTPRGARGDDSRAQHPRADMPEDTAKTNQSEDPLVAAIRAGSEVAFQQLVVARYRGLVSIAQGYLGDRAAAEDIVQETLWDLWNRRERLDPTRPIGPYLFGAVRHAVYRIRRRERLADQYVRDTLNDPATDLTMSPRDLTDEDLLTRARAAVALLSSRDQEVLELRLQGLTFADIGEALGLPLKTVATRTSRAVARLRHVLFKKG